MNRCHQCNVLLVWVFAAVSFQYGQTADDEVTKAGLVEYGAGHLERAEILLRNAVETALQKGDDYTAAMGEVYLGDVYQNEDRLTEAEQVYSKALSVFRRIPNKRYEQALVLRNLASVYSLNWRDSEALKTLHEASQLIKENTRIEKTLAAQILNGFAVVYFRQGKTRKAESQLVRAITLADETEPTLGYAQVLNNLGRVYQKRRKFDKAEEAFKQSLEITERLGSANLENIVQTAWNVEVAITLNNLAAVYAETRRYDEAESLYRRSLMILEQTKPSLDAKIVRTLHSLSRMYSKQGSIALAQSVLARAVEIGRLNPSCRQDMPTILETYAVVLKMLGQSNEAQRLRAEARHIRAEIGLTVRAPNW